MTQGGLLLREVRLVPVGTPAPDGPVDVRVRDGVVTEVAPHLAREPAEAELPAAGRWAAPGLWDAHVHLGQWALARRRLDTGGTAGPEDVVRRVAAHLRDEPGDDVVVGYGHRSAAWARSPTVAELDAVSGERPVVLISGDAHNGWLNTAALRLVGAAPRTGALVEQEWFEVLARLDRLPSSVDVGTAYRDAVREAAARGVVGIGDMEWERGWQVWPGRVAAGVDRLRVRAATYPDGLDDVLAAGLRTGDRLDDAGLVTMGPLKVIFDGSVNTATAYCCEPYLGPGGASGRGTLNLSPAELAELLDRAHRGGLSVAVHAIGDAAVSRALDAIGATGAVGTIEHAQLVAPSDLPRFAALGVAASVQPAHLLDDRDVSTRMWPDRQERCFPLGSLLGAGAELRMGSDAPVAPLDPWLAMAAAVHRSADDRPPWTPSEHLTAAQALAASTAGRGTLQAGSLADVVLLDADPLAPQRDSSATAAHLRTMPVAATLVAGRVTFAAL